MGEIKVNNVDTSYTFNVGRVTTRQNQSIDNVLIPFLLTLNKFLALLQGNYLFTVYVNDTSAKLKGVAIVLLIVGFTQYEQGQ